MSPRPSFQPTPTLLDEAFQNRDKEMHGFLKNHGAIHGPISKDAKGFLKEIEMGSIKSEAIKTLVKRFTPKKITDALVEMKAYDVPYVSRLLLGRSEGKLTTALLKELPPDLRLKVLNKPSARGAETVLSELLFIPELDGNDILNLRKGIAVDDWIKSLSTPDSSLHTPLHMFAQSNTFHENLESKLEAIKKDISIDKWENLVSLEDKFKHTPVSRLLYLIGMDDVEYSIKYINLFLSSISYQKRVDLIKNDNIKNILNGVFSNEDDSTTQLSLTNRLSHEQTFDLLLWLKNANPKDKNILLLKKALALNPDKEIKEILKIKKLQPVIAELFWDKGKQHILEALTYGLELDEKMELQLWAQ